MLKPVLVFSIVTSLLLSCSAAEVINQRGRKKQARLEGASLALTNAGHMNPETYQVYQNLSSIMNQKRVILGQQRATLVGLGAQGSSPFGDGQYSFRSDLKQLSNQHPGIMGIDVWDFAMKNATWNQPAYARAIKDFYAGGQGGLVSFEWHMRGCDTNSVRDAAGNSGIPGDGFMLRGPTDSQRSCVCRIVNEEPWKDGKTWLDWLYQEKLDKFAAKLEAEQLTQTPFLFRPFHEQSGDWFWWGAASWDCKSLLGKDNVIQGPDAYKALFQRTVRYLKEKKGLRNLIYTFSPDKLHYAPWIGQYGSSNPSEMSVEQLRSAYYHIYPGDDVVDVIGLDLYYPEDPSVSSRAYHTEIFRKNLRALTRIAIEKNKVSALTETGNYNLHAEAFQANTDFFSRDLSELIFNDPQIRLAYALLWENRALDKGLYYTPFQGHGQFPDFARFLSNPALLQYNDLRGFFTSSLAQSADSFAFCDSASSDPENDGWGWENNLSCRVVKRFTTQYPSCFFPNPDADGNGWGWENSLSCLAGKL